jgi:hypothetical protein
MLSETTTDLALERKRTGPRRRLTPWQVLLPASGELRVAFVGPVLRYEEVRVLFEWLQRNRCCTSVTFDFGSVREIYGPWAPLFAHLEYVVRSANLDCRILGLNADLATKAAFAMDDGGELNDSAGAELKIP